MSNHDRILRASLSLFNQAGVAVTSTNHVAAALGISPGNLYFHFTGKEDILRHLFEQMADEVEALWAEALAAPEPWPLRALLERSLGIFWQYRCFHREMYHLRRRDARLGRMWRQHLARSLEQLTAIHRQWAAAGLLKPLDPGDLEALVTLEIVTLSSALQLYESREKAPSHAYVERSIALVEKLLAPYLRQDERH